MDASEVSIRELISSIPFWQNLKVPVIYDKRVLVIRRSARLQDARDISLNTKVY